MHETSTKPRSDGANSDRSVNATRAAADATPAQSATAGTDGAAAAVGTAPHAATTEAAAARAAARARLAGHGAMIGFSIIVAGSFTFGAIAAPMADPVALNGVRFLIAAGLMAGLVAIGPGFETRAFRDPWRHLVLGGLFAVYFVLLFEALRLTTPVSVSAVFTLTPAMTALFGWWLLAQRMTAWMAAAIVIAALGALWVIFEADWAQARAFAVGRGEALFFFGCVAHALFTPLVARWSRGESAVVYTFAINAACCLVLLVYGARSIAATEWTALPWVFWAVVLYLAVLASAGSFFLLRFAALRLDSAKVMAYTYLVPSWVILLEGLIGQGWADRRLLVGVGLTVAALLMLLRHQGEGGANPRR